jgi:hypothetical protein
MKTRFLVLTLLTFTFLQPPAPAEAGLGGGYGVGRSSSQIVDGLFRPWSGPLAELGQKLPPRGNFVVWMNLPAQHPMDLRSGEHFRRWALPIPQSELSISHSMIAWRCEGPGGRWITGATGVTAASGKQEQQMFLNGFGLSVFLSTFTDAYLQTEAEVGRYIRENLPNRGLVATGFEVSKSQCDSMLAFLHRYIHHPSRPHSRYSFMAEPEKLEGASCVSLVAAMLRKAGVLAAVVPDFQRTMSAPRHLAGGNLPAPSYVVPPRLPWLQGRPHRVSYNTLRNSYWDKRSGQPMISIRFMDPELMLYAQKQMARAYLEQLAPNERRRQGTLLAASPLGTRMVRSADGHSVVEFPIDSRFDRQMAQVSRKSYGWYQERIRGGYQIRRESMMGGWPLLILHRR